jgi:hypothetical protein
MTNTAIDPALVEAFRRGDADDVLAALDELVLIAAHDILDVTTGGEQAPSTLANLSSKSISRWSAGGHSGNVVPVWRPATTAGPTRTFLNQVTQPDEVVPCSSTPSDGYSPPYRSCWWPRSRLARAKGLRNRVVMRRHALRTALIPLTTISALVIAGTLQGAVITETAFQWRGLGVFFVDAVGRDDLYAVMAFVMLTGIIVVVFNLIADLLYAVLDPRIRYD